MPSASGTHVVRLATSPRLLKGGGYLAVGPEVGDYRELEAVFGCPAGVWSAGLDT